MSWTTRTKSEEETALYHRRDTQHTFRKEGIELVTDRNSSVARISKDRQGQRCPNTINLDRSEIDTMLALLTALRDTM